ncbi:MAG: alpha/beta fold hydrolase, partial [Desulfobulbaceae bacterium]|nr:alpha/beta fold hydrolase [Desulfobulbaceae bacterium]
MSVTFLPCNYSVSTNTGASPQLPLFFLPGWGFDGRIMALASTPVECFVPAGVFDPGDLVEDLAAFLDGAGLKKIRLAGWSMGANLALEFARTHPERVDSLFLFSMRKCWP